MRVAATEFVIANLVEVVTLGMAGFCTEIAVGVTGVVARTRDEGTGLVAAFVVLGLVAGAVWTTAVGT